MKLGFVFLLLATVAVGSLLADKPIAECEQPASGLLKRITPNGYYMNMLRLNSETLRYDAHEHVDLVYSDQAGEPIDTIVMNLSPNISISEIVYWYEKYDEHGGLISIRKIPVLSVCRDSKNELLVIRLIENLAVGDTGTLTLTASSTIPKQQQQLVNLIGLEDSKEVSICEVLPCFNDNKFESKFILEFVHDKHLKVSSKSGPVSTRDSAAPGLFVSTLQPRKSRAVGEVSFTLRQI